MVLLSFNFNCYPYGMPGAVAEPWHLLSDAKIQNIFESSKKCPENYCSLLACYRQKVRAIL